MNNYNHKNIEERWQKQWRDAGLYTTQNSVEGKENYYTLVEFPYPSGDLHVGHWYAFAITDIYARYYRMLGYNVLFPFGFDAFGLPAENAAIKRNLNPRDWTYSNMETMKDQIYQMGSMIDWSREITTCDPSYYKWTQWLFLQMYGKGLAEQKETPVNWCPSCKTVLANEQVVAGQCERCGADVQQKNMNQWILKITQYADRLIDDMDELNWPNEIKASQKNWIGKSSGSEISFPLTNSDKTTVSVFTTRPDTLFGATYIVIAPEHQLVQDLKDDITNWSDVEKYVLATAKKSDLDRMADQKDKTGAQLEGFKAINPANNQEIPVFISDYVLAHYGTGCVMAVPAHDSRDFEFATKFNLPINHVIQPESGSDDADSNKAYSGDGVLINSGECDGISVEEAKQKITDMVNGKMTNTYKLRDWIISRQRYWGCPIPIIHCADCGSVPVPDDQLPVELPEIDNYLPRDDGKSPLAKATDWMNVPCPKCNKDAERETDTFDTFMDSSWYFLRYLDPKNDTSFASPDILSQWMPVDFYSGGAEHTTMHLLYSRFFQKALFDIGLVKNEEPYKVRLNRGLIMGPDGNKMSKSKGNVINPDDIVERLGSDTLRLYLAFIGPYNEAGSFPWDPNGVVGVRRFIERVWRIGVSELKDAETESMTKLLHKTIKKVRGDSGKLKFNTAISAMMIYVNGAEKDTPSITSFKEFIKLLAPYTPHVTEELWKGVLGEVESIHTQPSPDFEESKLVDDSVTVAVQVNGKVRANIDIEPDSEQSTVEKLALDQIEKWLGGKKPSKIIYIKNRVINIVIT